MSASSSFNVFNSWRNNAPHDVFERGYGTLPRTLLQSCRRAPEFARLILNPPQKKNVYISL